MSALKFYKVTSLPQTLAPDAFYLVLNSGYSESYVTDSSGVAKAIGNSAMITALANAAINSALAAYNALEIASNITARNALPATRPHNFLVLVVDATGDTTVSSGAALYAYNQGSSAFSKVAEYESMDVVLQWTSIQGRPTSAPAQIDSAVSQAHTHANKTTLDQLGDDGNGNLTYKGSGVTTTWAATNW